MYLSRVALDMTRQGTMLALQKPSMLHGAVEQSFEPRTSRALWRLRIALWWRRITRRLIVCVRR